MKGKKLTAQKPSAPSTSSKLKVKLPTIKSTSKDIADDVKAIREALNLKPDVSPKKKKVPPFQQKGSRKRSPTRSAFVNGHENDVKSNLDDIMLDLVAIKPESNDATCATESRQTVGQHFNGSPQRGLMQNMESDSPPDSSFVSPTGRPMRSRKPNQRYTDLLSETEPGRRRRTTSKHSTTSNDEDMIVYPYFDKSPLEQKAKMKKTKKRKNDAVFAKSVVIMSAPKIKTTTGMPKKERMKKKWIDLKPDTVRKYLGKIKKEQRKKKSNVTTMTPPLLIKGEFEQPPEFFEIQERALSPVDLETNMMNAIESDDNLPPILPISALMTRPLSPGPAPKSPPQKPFLSPQHPPSTVASIVPIPNSLLNSSGELDFSQFTMPDDELPQSSSSSQYLFSPVPKLKKSVVKKGPQPASRGLNNNLSSAATTTFPKAKTFMLGLSNYTVPSSFGESHLHLPPATEKPPPQRRRPYSKSASRSVQREEKIMRMETEEALQGIKPVVQDVQDPLDIKPSAVNVVKPTKIRRGRFSNVASVARFVDDCVIYGPSAHAPSTRVHRPLPPRPQRMNFDEVEKFCSLPPQVAGDHCYGKQQSSSKVDPTLSHGHGGGSEMASSSSRRSYDDSRSSARPPSLTKIGVGNSRGRGGGRRVKIAHQQMSPSPPPYNQLVHGLSPTYTNDPSLGAYYGATDDGYSDDEESNDVRSLPGLNKSGNNSLGGRLPSNILDDDADDSDASDEHITRVDIQ